MASRHQAGGQQPELPADGCAIPTQGVVRHVVVQPEGSRRPAAMQTYGLVLADNGSPWYFQGEASAKWPSNLISDLKRVPARAFVAVDTSSLMVDEDSARVAPQ